MFSELTDMNIFNSSHESTSQIALLARSTVDQIDLWASQERPEFGNTEVSWITKLLKTRMILIPINLAVRFERP